MKAAANLWHGCLLHLDALAEMVPQGSSQFSRALLGVMGQVHVIHEVVRMACFISLVFQKLPFELVAGWLCLHSQFIIKGAMKC